MRQQKGLMICDEDRSKTGEVFTVLGLNFGNLTENDWFMIEGLIGESLLVNGYDDELEEDFFGENMMDMFFEMGQ